MSKRSESRIILNVICTKKTTSEDSFLKWMDLICIRALMATQRQRLSIESTFLRLFHSRCVLPADREGVVIYGLPKPTPCC